MELLQTTTAQFIPKCDGIVTNCEGLVYYKVRWLLQIASVQCTVIHCNLKEEVDYISKYPEIDNATFRMHARSHRENVASVDRRFISKKELHAHLPLVMTNYVRRRRALNEEFVSFSCELPYYILFPVGWFRHNLR